MWKLILHSRTLSLCSKSSMKYRRNPPCNAEDNLCAGLIVIEVLFRDYYGSPRLGGPRTAGLYAYAELLDYEDTRLKTSSHVWEGLSLAWKASLTIWICSSPTIVTDFV